MPTGDDLENVLGWPKRPSIDDATRGSALPSGRDDAPSPGRGQRSAKVAPATRSMRAEVESLQDLLVDLSDRLGRLEHVVGRLSEGVRASWTVADALEQFEERLSSVADTTARVAEDVQALLRRADGSPQPTGLGDPARRAPGPDLPGRP